MVRTTEIGEMTMSWLLTWFSVILYLLKANKGDTFRSKAGLCGRIRCLYEL